MPIHEDLLKEFESLARTAASADSLMQRVSDRMHEGLSRYNWVGFYVVDKNDSTILLVGPHTGSFTPNIRIPLDRGLCGAAATTGKTVVVDDVRKDPRYLQGSDLVKSEIVVPIFVGRQLVGELDVNSYFSATFTKEEQQFVEACADIVRKYIEAHPG